MAVTEEHALPVVWHKICSVLRQPLARQPLCMQAGIFKLSYHQALSHIHQVEMDQVADAEVWAALLIIDAFQGCQILSIRAQAGGKKGLGKLHCPCEGPLRSP